MSKKHTIEYIKERFEDRGCVLKSTKYVDAKTKLDYVCPNGHFHNMSWNSFDSGSGCPYCAGNAKQTIGYIRHEFKKRNLVLNSEEYVNAHTKLDYTCFKGHKHSITWDKFKQGKGCPYCAGNAKLTMDIVKSNVERFGYVLESSVYVNAHTKLDYICPKGHKHSMTYYHFQQGRRCPTCHHLSSFGEGHPRWRGGKTNGQYCDAWCDNEYKLSLKQRDGFKCQNPCCSCSGGDLCLHHIDYNKENCHPSNLIILCRSCHGYSNANRGWHTAWYQAYMSKKYGYIY